MKGASTGTSVASTVLNKKVPVRLPTPVINQTGVRLAYTVCRWTQCMGQRNSKRERRNLGYQRRRA
jgi:hypothetical protein